MRHAHAVLPHVRAARQPSGSLGRFADRSRQLIRCWISRPLRLRWSVRDSDRHTSAPRSRRPTFAQVRSRPTASSTPSALGWPLGRPSDGLVVSSLRPAFADWPFPTPSRSSRTPCQRFGAHGAPEHRQRSVRPTHDVLGGSDSLIPMVLITSCGVGPPRRRADEPLDFRATSGRSSPTSASRATAPTTPSARPASGSTCPGRTSARRPLPASGPSCPATRRRASCTGGSPATTTPTVMPPPDAGKPLTAGARSPR